MSVRSLLLIIGSIPLIYASCNREERRNLTTNLLSSIENQLSYDQINELAIRDAISLHEPILKSPATRIVKNLDGLWDFCLDPDNKGFVDRWFNTVASLYDNCETQEQNFHRMPIPSAFNDVTADNRLHDYIGWVWYQKEIILTSKIDEDFDWLLHFESSNYLTLVWVKQVNDQEDAQLLVSHVGGHLPFMANLTKLFECSSRKPSGKIRVTIAVSNILTQDTIPSGSIVDLSQVVGKRYGKFQPDFDFFHFAGLIGSVNLLKLSRNHLVGVLELNRTIIDYAKKVYYTFEIHLNSLTTKQGSKTRTEGIDLQVEVIDGNDCLMTLDSPSIISVNTSIYHLVLSQQWIKNCSHKPNVAGKLTILYLKLINKENSIELDVYEHRVAPWFKRVLNSSKGLFLFDGLSIMHSESKQGNISHDKTLANEIKGTIPIGIKAAQKTMKLRFNQHNRVLLRGFGMHHEQFFSGRTMSLSAIMKDLNLINWFGANVIRTSHYPYSTAYLNACDELGISVIAECQAVGLKSFSSIKLALHKQLLLEMMQRDHGHPSIIAWSVANEPQSQLPASKAYFESLLDYARNDLKEYTEGRPLTAAIAQSYSEDKIGHTLDFIMINNYFGWYDYLGVLDAIEIPLKQDIGGWSKRFPEKGIMVSEFGADTISGLHSAIGAQPFSEEYQKELILRYESIFDQLWCSNMNNDNNSIRNFIGSMIWNFADFSTHDSLLRVGGNRKGLLNRDRTPKMAARAVKLAYFNQTSCS